MEKILIKDLKKLSKETFKGKVICYPTDTVYGLGAMIDDADAIKKIYKIKHREERKPLAILIDDSKEISKYVTNIFPEAQRLIDKYWPGPLTIIFNKNDYAKNIFNDGFSTIAFRMPNSPISLQVINHLGYLATTSVNISGETELNSYDEIFNVFQDEIDYLVCDETILSKLPSTIIDATTSTLKVIREGSIKI